jgi:hypothetical protein
MDSFASFVRTLGDTANGEVRVAVIDDGLDVTLGYFQDNIAEGKSYCELGGRIRDYFVCPSGHGTLMASLICRICPTAKLYIVKLQEYPRANGAKHFTVESATRVSFPLIAIYSCNC